MIKENNIVKEERVMYEILENGTEITFKGDRAYIMGHDDGEFDESHDRLNYHIGFAKDGETYQDVENRLDSKGTWYDTMITWQSAKVISKYYFIKC